MKLFLVVVVLGIGRGKASKCRTGSLLGLD
jgi:hypothetical protein